MYLVLCFDKSFPWPVDIHGSKISFYRNIFLSQYCEQKCLVCNSPKGEVVYRVYQGFEQTCLTCGSLVLGSSQFEVIIVQTQKSLLALKVTQKYVSFYFLQRFSIKS